MVEYKKGVENKVADALSRRNEATEDEEGGQSCRVVSVVEPSWLIEVRRMLEQSPFFQQLQLFLSHPIQEDQRSLVL